MGKMEKQMILIRKWTLLKDSLIIGQRLCELQPLRCHVSCRFHLDLDGWMFGVVKSAWILTVGVSTSASSSPDDFVDLQNCNCLPFFYIICLLVDVVILTGCVGLAFGFTYACCQTQWLESLSMSNPRHMHWSTQPIPGCTSSRLLLSPERAHHVWFPALCFL